MKNNIFSPVDSLNKLRYQRFFRLAILTIIGLWLAQVLFPTWRLLPLIYGQQTVPWHYNIHFGVDKIGAWWRIYTVPMFSLVFILLNMVGAQLMWKKEPVLSYIFIGATLLLEVILSLAMFFIVLLVISYG